jgi:hypothetical protein
MPCPITARQGPCQLKRYHAAVRDFSRAITLNPKYAAAYHNRADAYHHRRLQGAGDDATQAMTLEPGCRMRSPAASARPSGEEFTATG